MSILKDKLVEIKVELLVFTYKGNFEIGDGK